MRIVVTSARVALDWGAEGVVGALDEALAGGPAHGVGRPAGDAGSVCVGGNARNRGHVAVLQRGINSTMYQQPLQEGWGNFYVFATFFCRGDGFAHLL